MDPIPYLQELLAKGGVIMWIIVACSVIAVFIILERVWHYHRAQIDVAEFFHGLTNVLKRKNVMEAVAICDDAPGPVANVIRAAVVHAGEEEGAIRRAIEEAALVEVPRLEKNLKTLATITHITPLLGLLGTVVGMIGAFQTIEGAGTFVSTSQLAKHIWEALLTTAAGLSVAIPASAFYNLLHGRVESIMLDMERAATEIIHFLRHNPIRTGAGEETVPGTADEPAAAETAKQQKRQVSGFPHEEEENRPPIRLF